MNEQRKIMSRAGVFAALIGRGFFGTGAVRRRKPAKVYDEPPEHIQDRLQRNKLAVRRGRKCQMRARELGLPYRNVGTYVCDPALCRRVEEAWQRHLDAMADGGTYTIEGMIGLPHKLASASSATSAVKNPPKEKNTDDI